MRQIAREVGVQAGTIYLYTPDKQTLLFELMQDHMTDLLAAWDRQTNGDNVDHPPAEQLRQFTKFHLFYHLDRPDAVFISYMELRNLNPQNFKAVENLRRSYENRLETVLKRGVKQLAFDLSDTKLTTLALIAMLTGVNTWFRQEGRLSRDNVEEIYWDMVRKLVSIQS